MIKGLIKLSRVEDFYGSATAITGVSLVVNPSLSLFDRGLLLIIVLLLNVFAFAINDIEDAEDDAKDPAKVNRNPISAGILKKKEALVFTWSIAVLSLLLLLKFGAASTAIGLLTIIVGFLYSFKSIRLKSIPFLDIISHGLFLGGLQSLVIITAYNNPLTTTGILLTILIFFQSTMGDINNEIRDYEVDRATGIKNTASVLNLVKAKSFMHFLQLLPVIALAVIIFTKINQTALVVLLILIAITIIYYVIAYASKRKRGFYDKHSQQLIAFFGLILLATV